MSNGIELCGGGGADARSRGRRWGRWRLHIIHQRLHEFLDLRQFAKRVKLGQLNHELVRIERIQRALILQLSGQQLQKRAGQVDARSNGGG